MAETIETKSRATNVDAMRKYREAKAAEAQQQLSGSAGRGEKPAPPPKVDLYK